MQVIEDDKQWWKLRNRSGQVGFVPFNHLDILTPEDLHGGDAKYSSVKLKLHLKYFKCTDSVLFTEHRCFFV